MGSMLRTCGYVDDRKFADSRRGGASGWSEWVVWWRIGQGARLATPNVAMQFDSRPFSFHLGQVVHIHLPLSPSSMIWYRSRGGDALQLGR